MTYRKIYLVGSLRNPEIPEIAEKLRAAGHSVFDDWYAAGPQADDSWRDYSIAKGQSYRKALCDYAAKHVFAFDKRHLVRCDTVVLALPAGKSGHLELGWATGWRDCAEIYQSSMAKEAHIILDRPDRWDVMYLFANGVWDNVDELTSHWSNQP